jgi:hypothetical protein
LLNILIATGVYCTVVIATFTAPSSSFVSRLRGDHPEPGGCLIRRATCHGILSKALVTQHCNARQPYEVTCYLMLVRVFASSWVLLEERGSKVAHDLDCQSARNRSGERGSFCHARHEGGAEAKEVVLHAACGMIPPRAWCLTADCLCPCCPCCPCCLCCLCFFCLYDMDLCAPAVVTS